MIKTNYYVSVLPQYTSQPKALSLFTHVLVVPGYFVTEYSVHYIDLKLSNNFTWGQTQKVLPLVFYFNITPLP